MAHALHTCWLSAPIAGQRGVSPDTVGTSFLERIYHLIRSLFPFEEFQIASLTATDYGYALFGQANLKRAWDALLP